MSDNGAIPDSAVSRKALELLQEWLDEKKAYLQLLIERKADRRKWAESGNPDQVAYYKPLYSQSIQEVSDLEYEIADVERAVTRLSTKSVGEAADHEKWLLKRAGEGIGQLQAENEGLRSEIELERTKLSSLIQSIRDGLGEYLPNKSAEDLVGWIESTCPFVGDIGSSTSETAVQPSSKLCPDDVQRYFEEHYNAIFASGQRNHHECDICNAIEQTAKMLGYKVDYRFDQQRSDAIIIPGIKDGTSETADKQKSPEMTSEDE